MTCTVKSIKETLEILSDTLTDLCSNINSGGCGIVAAMVGKQMESIGVTVEIVTPTKSIYGDKANSPNDARRGVNNIDSPSEWDDNGICRNHLALRFKLGDSLYTWDSDGLLIGGKTFGNARQYDCDYPFGEGLTVEETRLMCIPLYAWNCIFDRSIVPELQNAVYNAFEYVKGLYVEN